jgi:acyl carrier protein
MGLEGVEIVMGWEEALGVSLSDAETPSLRTPRQAVQFLAAKLNAVEEVRPCLTQRAFHHLRRSLMASGVPRTAIRPDAKLKVLLQRHGADSGLETWRDSEAGSLLGQMKGSTTAGEAARMLALTPGSPARRGDRSWSRCEIREVVRSIIIEVMGADDFHDDSDFVRDIGIG